MFPIGSFKGLPGHAGVDMAMLMLAFHGLLLAPQVSALSAFTDDAYKLREHQHHAVTQGMAGTL